MCICLFCAVYSVHTTSTHFTGTRSVTVIPASSMRPRRSSITTKQLTLYIGMFNQVQISSKLSTHFFITAYATLNRCCLQCGYYIWHSGVFSGSCCETALCSCENKGTNRFLKAFLFLPVISKQVY